MKLYLIRHGETFGNVANVMQGHLDEAFAQLNEKGKLQAQKLGERFKEVHIDAIYTSDLKRAINTAKEIAKFHPHIPFIIDKNIRERKWGDYEGKPFPKDLDWQQLPKNIESNADLQKRAKTFLDTLYTKHKNQTVVVVCHGAIKRECIKLFQNIAPHASIDLKPKNTSVSLIEFTEDNKHNIHLLNCTNHLD